MLSHQPEVSRLLHQEYVARLAEDAQQPVPARPLTPTRHRAHVPAGRSGARRAGRHASALAHTNMSNLDAELMAERLGLTEPLIRQLQARGYFERLAIDEDELRTRLLRGYLSSLSEALPATRTT